MTIVASWAPGILVPGSGGDEVTWTYDQSSGDLFHNGAFIGTGYSGKGRTKEDGRNNGDKQAIHEVGPIPRGFWKIGRVTDRPKTGVISIQLTPKPPETALGRTGFFIHGNNQADDASTGCIILARGLRLEIVGSGDAELEVVA